MHKIKRKVQQKQESRILSFTPVRTYFLLFLMLYLLLVICAGSTADDSFDEAVGAGGTAKCSSADIAAD
ncbi:MAG: hypothetical protein ACLTDX_21225 [[Clostridium] innocuum]